MLYQKEKSHLKSGFLSSGSQTRTDDLWVMSPTSYQLLHPALYRSAKMQGCFEKNKYLCEKYLILFGK